MYQEECPFWQPVTPVTVPDAAIIGSDDHPDSAIVGSHDYAETTAPDFAGVFDTLMTL